MAAGSAEAEACATRRAAETRKGKQRSAVDAAACGEGNWGFVAFQFESNGKANGGGADVESDKDILLSLHLNSGNLTPRQIEYIRNRATFFMLINKM